MTGSSMVKKFTKPEDLEQACYEAAVDLAAVFVEHIMGIARRSKENFPEVAAGLEGTAAGMAQYLRGIDGRWKTDANLSLKEILSQPEFLDHMWAYEFTRDPACGVILMGCVSAVAAKNPDLTFWEALRIARTKIADYEPLVEQLLKSSPMRKVQ